MIARHNGKFGANMGTPLRELSPSRAFEEVGGRSYAISVAAGVAVAMLQAIGILPILYRPSLAPASAALSALFTSQALFLTFYHRRAVLAIWGTAISWVMPFLLNLLWARFTQLSLLYPLMTVWIGGEIAFCVIHYRVSGPDPELDALAEELDRDPEPLPVPDRFLLLGLVVGTALLIWVHLAR